MNFMLMKINTCLLTLILFGFITLKAQEKLSLPELGDRVSGAVSITEEKLLEKSFLNKFTLKRL